MNRPHIIATDVFHLEVYDLTPQTKALLKQAAQYVTDTLQEKTERLPKDEQRSPPEKVSLKPAEKKKNKKKQNRLFDEKELLARYHKVPVYGPIVRYIDEHIDDTITSKAIKSYIKTYYKKFLNRELSKQSLRSYASAYIRYYKENRSFVEQLDEQNWVRKTEKEEKEELPRRMVSEKFEYGHQIYEAMAKTNGMPQVITIEQIMNRTKLTKDQVEMGIGALIQQNLAIQQPRGIQLRGL
jgi:hypothetical protein